MVVALLRALLVLVGLVLMLLGSFSIAAGRASLFHLGLTLFLAGVFAVPVLAEGL